MNAFDKFNWDRCLSYARGIWENDHRLTNSAFLKTGEFVEKTMRDIGLEEVEVLKAHADGRTRYAEWVIPEAWEVKGARLTYEDGEIIADYDENPCSLSMRSAKTPAGGIWAEVVDADGLAPDEWMRGKLLLTSKSAASIRDNALKFGAAGILSDFFPMYKGIRESREEMTGVSRWDVEFIPERNDTNLFAFSITPERGDGLRKRLKAGEKIRLHAQVDTELFDGYVPVVSGAILGEKRELGEIFLYGHLYEPGANDNASGCALLLECMNIYADMIRRGEAKKPQRTIRLALGQECMGSNAYLLKHPDRKGQMCIVADMVGTEKIDNATLGVWHSPFANWSFLDDLIEEIVESAKEFGDFEHKSRPYGIATDNMLGDPCFHMPTVALITEPAKSYHSSMDTPERLEESVMRRNAWIVFEMIKALSNAQDEADLPCEYKYTERMKEHARTALEKTFWEAKIHSMQAEKQAFLGGETSCLNLCDFSLPETPKDILNIYVTRIKDGCMTLDKIDPLSGRRFETAWNTHLHRPLYWANGRRNVWEIACLVAMEEGKSDYSAAYDECMSLFRALSESGVVTMTE
ncbi:MAG: DUF4910 domain-containing protein [Clostridia bacterium]|nr:DUF4910 domain-containing protein [Clostridia bacterium]